MKIQKQLLLKLHVPHTQHVLVYVQHSCEQISTVCDYFGFPYFQPIEEQSFVDSEGGAEQTVVESDKHDGLNSDKYAAFDGHEDARKIVMIIGHYYLKGELSIFALGEKFIGKEGSCFSVVLIVMIEHTHHILDVLSLPQEQGSNGKAVVLAECEKLHSDRVAAH